MIFFNQTHELFGKLGMNEEQWLQMNIFTWMFLKNDKNVFILLWRHKGVANTTDFTTEAHA